MATIVETLLIDDLDGSPAERTVRFALDGQDYETELAPGNLALLEDTLAKYIAAGRPVKPAKNGRQGKRPRTLARIITPRPQPVAQPPAPPAERREIIRRWAQAERPDLGVGARGRLASAAIAAYNAAHGFGS
jgi:hypothetical protein